jgi:hypothetical protein
LVALDFLQGIVDAEIAALEALREELVPLFELNRAEAPLRSAIDDTKEGALRLRYDKSNERELHRCLADFLKMKKAGIGGESAPETTEVDSGSKDTSSVVGSDDARRNEANWGGPVASDGTSVASNVAPEGSNRGESPPR